MTLDEYLSRPGAESMAEFARRLGVNQDQVRQWRHSTDGRRPSAGSAVLIEQATAGDVPVETLRSDLQWVRKRDKRWPHPNGRPLQDHATEAA
jgi:DNA-binding transcriptional regulator YdaS (Cro superfamily)